MTWLKRGFVLKGYIAEVQGLTTVELFQDKEKVESLMCAHSAMEKPLDVEDDPEEVQVKIGEWASAREEDAQTLYNQVQVVKADLCKLVVERLQRAEAAMRPLAKGQSAGQSWKHGLSEDPAMHEVYAAAEVILHGDTARKVAAAYKDLKKEWCSCIKASCKHVMLPQLLARVCACPSIIIVSVKVASWKVSVRCVYVCGWLSFHEVTLLAPQQQEGSAYSLLPSCQCCLFCLAFY